MNKTIEVTPIMERQIKGMISLMREASDNLSQLMDTETADTIGVRHFLPDELYGCAVMLKDIFEISDEKEN